jgi:Protein of unknown function DUF262
MKMTGGKRALDKIYKRRNRYDIPEWQRGEVWDIGRKQQLIDSILRGWKLPKFYLLKQSDEQYEVVDGQQRLSAVFEFFSNELSLPIESVSGFGGQYYKDLNTRSSDAFDDFEIEYDEIEEASEEEIKLFFQRLQQGLPLSSSEKLNSVHSKLRDFCKKLTDHKFFSESISISNTRLAHFDITTKVAAIEVEGIDTSLRFDEVAAIFEHQKSFSSSSAVAKRIKNALDFLLVSFPRNDPALKNRTVVQSVITLACKFVANKKSAGLEAQFAKFIRWFLDELAKQVELGQKATDYDFIAFQKSINANVKAGARIRQEILFRKALVHSMEMAKVFSSAEVAASGMSLRVNELGESIGKQIGSLNSAYAGLYGDDLFKATNKTAQALRSLGEEIKDKTAYVKFIDDLYFLFRESIGQRLSDQLPHSFVDINALRTDLQHDVDHGDAGKVRAKRKKMGSVFEKYSGAYSPDVLDPLRFVLVQVNILSAIDLDLINLKVKSS